MRFLAGNAAAVEHSGKLWMYVTQSKMSCDRGYEPPESQAKELASYAPCSGFRGRKLIIRVERSVGRSRKGLEPLADLPVSVRIWPPFLPRTPRNLRSSLAGWCNEEPHPDAQA